MSRKLKLSVCIFTENDGELLIFIVYITVVNVLYILDAQKQQQNKKISSLPASHA
jgi:hypothetical protein